MRLLPALFPALLPALLPALALLLAVPSPARAAEYPAGPVRILVGFAAGGAPDALARLVADRLAAAWKQPVTVENRAGAAGNLAMSAVAKAEPDGLTLALVPVGNAAVNPTLFADLPYDIVRDFAPVTLIATVENVLVVSARSPATTLAELFAQGRSGAPLTYATPGAGSLAHLAAERLGRAAKVPVSHVPYRGVTPALTDVMRGEVAFTVAQLSTAKPLIESGQLRALGVASRERSPVLPDVPTLAEAAGLPGFEAVSWYALMAPARTPPEVVGKIQAEVARLVREPATAEAMRLQGAEPVASTPAELSAAIARDTARWAAVIRDAGIEIR